MWHGFQILASTFVKRYPRYRVKNLSQKELADLFKDPKMLQRFQDITNLEDKDKECLLTTVDHFIKASKISAM